VVLSVLNQTDFIFSKKIIDKKGFELKINIFFSNIYHSGLYSKITTVFSSHILSGLIQKI
jgi:hypothetical protein